MFPKRFGDKGHKRVPEFENCFEDVSKDAAVSAEGGSAFGGFLNFVNFDIPVGEIVPSEIAERLAGEGKLVTLEEPCHFTHCFFEMKEYPMIGRRSNFQLL